MEGAESGENCPDYGGHPRVVLSEKLSSEKCCIKVLRQIRPNWRKCDIILWKISPTSWVGYSVKNSMDKLLIKLFHSESSSASYLNTFQLYSELSLSPRLLGTFSHGLVTEFLPSPDTQLLHHATVYPIVARTVGTLHRLLSTNVELTEVNTFDTIARWLESLPSDANNNHLDAGEEAGLPELSDLVDELGQMEDVLVEVEMKTVMGHCNLTPANIVYNAFDQSVKFTGISNTGAIWQPLEIATLFLSLHDVHKLDVLHFPGGDCLPSRAVQIRWINNYLAAFNNVGLHQVSPVEMETLHRQVSLCALLHLLRQTVWAILMTRSDSVRAAQPQYNQVSSNDIRQYGASRFKLYKKIKYNLMALEI